MEDAELRFLKERAGKFYFGAAMRDYKKLGNGGNKGLVLNIAFKLRYLIHDGLVCPSIFSFIMENVNKAFICDNVPMRIYKDIYFKKAIERIFELNKNVINTDIQLNHEIIHSIINSIITKNSKYSHQFIRYLLQLSKLLSIVEEGEKNLQEFKGLLTNMNKYLAYIYEVVEKLDWNSPFYEFIRKIMKFL